MDGSGRAAAIAGCDRTSRREARVEARRGCGANGCCRCQAGASRARCALGASVRRTLRVRHSLNWLLRSMTAAPWRQHVRSRTDYGTCGRSGAPIARARVAHMWRAGDLTRAARGRVTRDRRVVPVAWASGRREGRRRARSRCCATDGYHAAHHARTRTSIASRLRSRNPDDAGRAESPGSRGSCRARSPCFSSLLPRLPPLTSRFTAAELRRPRERGPVRELRPDIAGRVAQEIGARFAPVGEYPGFADGRGALPLASEDRRMRCARINSKAIEPGGVRDSGRRRRPLAVDPPRPSPRRSG